MARYTKIPEVDFAGALSTSLGSLIAPILAKANKTLLSSEDKIRTIALTAFKESRRQASTELGCLQSYSDLDRIDTVLSTVTKSLDSILTTTNSLKVSVKALLLPVEALEAAILVIKMIPLPQMYLVVSVTTVFSDTLEMLSELVAQTKEVVDSATNLLDTIESLFEPVSSMKLTAQSNLQVLQADAALHCALELATPTDTQKLCRLGILDDLGDSIFNKLVQGATTKGYISFNGADISRDNVVKLKYAQEHKLSDFPRIKNLTVLSVSGIQKGVEIEPGSQTILLVDTITDVSTILSTSLQRLDDTTCVSVELKDVIRKLLNSGFFVEKEDFDKEKIMNTDTVEYFRTPNGTPLKLKIVKDPNSPKLAVRKYAVAVTGDGAIVAEGTKSFTLNETLLIEDLKLRLSQLFE